MDLNCIRKCLEKQPDYRFRQIEKSVFSDLIEEWDEAKVIPLELRKELGEKCPLKIDAEIFASKDGRTFKALLKLKDQSNIECVLMRHEKRNTVCVSSQVGCALGCAFCATGKMGFKRNLASGEIIEQVLFFARYLKKQKQKITNIVFMGMGEPFLNYENVMEAIKILNGKNGFNLGARHFSISTSGITEGIEKLSREKMEINLAVSLHAPNDRLRSKIMPVNKKYPLPKILKSVDDYIAKTKRKVMFEYIMIKGINDSDECAGELAKIMKKPLYFVNLIACNPMDEFKPSPGTVIKRFKSILIGKGVKAVQRYGFGQDIKAACGQLASE